MAFDVDTARLAIITAAACPRLPNLSGVCGWCGERSEDRPRGHCLNRAVKRCLTPFSDWRRGLLKAISEAERRALRIEWRLGRHARVPVVGIDGPVVRHRNFHA